MILRPFAAAVLVALPLLSGARQEPSQPATLAAAMARLQAKDPAGAAQILEKVVAADPANGRAWRNLGNAYQLLKQYDQAIAAQKKSLEIQPDVPTPLYALGDLYALEKNNDQAYAWLKKAAATHKIDMTQIPFDTDLDGFRADPRYPSLLPTPADFANPFVEPTTIIREWDGEAANDQFGWIARVIGDVDGDGVPDIATSAPTSDAGGKAAGRIYVYSTKSGKLLWKADGARPNDQLGSGIEAAGDTNHDGIPDVIASAPGSGVAYVYSGRDGRVLLTLKAEDAADNFGRHVSGVGDIDHDGYADIIVGAPLNKAAGQAAGRAYVYSGKDGHVLLTLTGERAGDQFGAAVAGGTDRTHSFIIVGAPGAGPRHTGRAYVYKSLSDRPAFIIDSDETGAALGGMFLAVAGDVDGDGVPDIYASDWPNNAKGPQTGRVYVHSGKDGHRLFAFTGEGPGEGFGTSPSIAGDVDGDGHADFIVGAWQYAGAAQSGGRAYLYSGKDGSLMKTITCRTPGDTFGFDSVGMGDVDGDGTVDFLITSGWSGVHGFHSGRVFIISSGIRKSAAGR